VLRLFSELFWSLRREGLAISPSQTIDALRAVELVGLDDKQLLRWTLATVLVTEARQRPAFEAAYDRFFSIESAHAGDLWQRLRARGLADEELSLLRDLARAADGRSGARGDGLVVKLLAGSASELEWFLSQSRMRTLRRDMTSASTVGFFAEKTAAAITNGASFASRLRQLMRDAVGQERAELVTRAVLEELSAMKRRIRANLELEVRRSTREGAADAGREKRGFGASVEERERTRRAVRAIVEKLDGQARVREKRARRGDVDVRATVRAALRTGGVPMRLVRRRPRRDKAKVVLLCDLSDSVRDTAVFLLEFVAAAHRLVRRVRTFVFVAEAREITGLLREQALDSALATIQSGAVLPLSGTSNYAGAWREVERVMGPTLDKRTTLVVLGDGRTNFKDPGLAGLAELRARARGLLWVCPEERERWGQADSQMPAYARLADRVLPAGDVADLERAARVLVRLTGRR
jgi:uncharacterized protein with von Willebrand factor type A (vWA) domain